MSLKPQEIDDKEFHKNNTLAVRLLYAGVALIGFSLLASVLFDPMRGGTTEDQPKEVQQEPSPVRSELPQKNSLTGALIYTLLPEVAKYAP